MFGVLMLVVIVIGLPLYWLLEPSRQAGAVERLRRAVRQVGSPSCSPPTADGGFNCAGCHGGMKATGGAAPYTVTDPNTGEVQAGRRGTRRRSTRCSTASASDEVRVHPHLRPAVLADVAVGPRRRRADERPADRQRSSPTCRAIQVPTEGCAEGEIICDDGHLPTGDPASRRADTPGRHPGAGREVGAGRHVQDARRGAVQPRRSTAAPTPAPAATPRAGRYGNPSVERRRRPRARTSPAAPTVRQFPNDSRPRRLRPDRLGERQEVRRSRARAAGRMPGLRPDAHAEQQIQAIVEYERSL